MNFVENRAVRAHESILIQLGNIHWCELEFSKLSPDRYDLVLMSASPAAIPDAVSTAKIMQMAHEMCVADHAAEIAQYGPLMPSTTLSPLFPPLRVDEFDYEGDDDDEQF